MALAPRLSLRSLLLLMSRGKPQPQAFCAFFSSSVTATGVLPAAPGADTPPAAPAVQPPVTTAGGPRTYREETALQPLHGGPRPPRAPPVTPALSDSSKPEGPCSARVCSSSTSGGSTLLET
ncbi:hypothetical protein ZWY2020_002635 [Hordeum vulgare]|nr:hypothetical protein ZWY2020_002635 [Hordeum vulgare]